MHSPSFKRDTDTVPCRAAVRLRTGPQAQSGPPTSGGPAPDPVEQHSPGFGFRRVLLALVFMAGWPVGVVSAAPSASREPKPSVRIIRFEDLKPADARLTTCWDAVGIDHEQRVYVAFSDQSDRHPFDTMLFRYDTRSGARELLGTLRGISGAEGNLQPGETIAKIHVPFQEYAGKFYFSSHDYHTYRGPADLAARRGGHFYSYDPVTGKFADLSKADPGGVSVEHQGIIGLTVLRKQNALAGLTFPFGDILIHDLGSHQTRLYPGVAEHRSGGKPTRQIFANDAGKVFFTYYDDYHDHHASPLYAFDVHTAKITQTPYSFQFGMLYGALRTHDGRKLYLVDLFGNLYVFHLQEERLEALGSLLPPEQAAAGVTVEICYSLVLSPDEKKLYTFPSRLSEAPALRMYEFNLETGARRQVADFTTELNGSSPGKRPDRNGRITGSGVQDAAGRMYFGYHESGDDGRNGALLQVTLPDARQP